MKKNIKIYGISIAAFGITALAINKLLNMNLYIPMAVGCVVFILFATKSTKIKP